MLVAARKTDICFCPKHLGGVVTDPSEPRVLICHQPVALKGDKVMCLDGSLATIIEGDESVLIGGKPVARRGDHIDHGGIILTGCPRVRIGRSPKAGCTLVAANNRSGLIRHRQPVRVLSGAGDGKDDPFVK